MNFDDYSDSMLENLRSDLSEEVGHFTEDDLLDPALNSQYVELCRKMDEVESEQMRRMG